MDKPTLYQSQLLRQHGSYPTRWLPKTLWQCLGLQMSICSLLTLCLVVVPAKLAVSYSRDNLYLLTAYHQCNGPIPLMWGRSTESDFRPAFHDILWSWQVALKKHWKGSLLSFPHEGKMILGIRSLVNVFSINVLKMKYLCRNPFCQSMRVKQ